MWNGNMNSTAPTYKKGEPQDFLYTVVIVVIVVIVYFGKDTANQFLDSFRTEPKENDRYIEEIQKKDTNIIEGEFK